MSRKTRKLIWAAPLVAVFAVVGALALFMAQAPNDASAQGLETPGQVDNFEMTVVGPTSIKLTWDEPTDGGTPSAYRIDVSDDGLTWKLLQGNLSGASDEYEHTGLSARETKYYRIFAHNTGGTQIGPVAYPTPASAMTKESTKPGAPQELRATRGTAVTPAALAATDVNDQRTSITLRWNPPATPPGTSIHEYKVSYAARPTDLGLNQIRTLKVVGVPTAKEDEVYCGYAGTDGACKYTFEKLLENQQWHYQVYAVNKDATGEVGTSNPSDTKDATTDKGLLPGQPTAVWAAVNKGSPGIWLYWTPPSNPDGAKVTDYLIQGKPATRTATPWGNNSSNAVIFHNRATSDLLLTEAELRRAASKAWTDDDRLALASQDLEELGTDFNKYFANLEWEFRVFALNQVWDREVEEVATVKNYMLGAHDSTAYGNLTTSDALDLSVDSGTGAPSNVSAVLTVSLNELDLVDDDTDDATPGQMEPERVNLQNRIARVSASADRDTHGGRTKIDLSWPRTYSHQTDPADDATRVYATEYRVQWSTDPDASKWNLLDRDTTTADHEDFLASAICSATTGMCSIPHEGLNAGVKYTYRVFAMNAADTDVNLANTVFSWWQVGSETTVSAKQPGAPQTVVASKSLSDRHTEITITWSPPTSDRDLAGVGDGYGVIVKYVMETSDDGGNTYKAYKTFKTEDVCEPAATADAAGATHKVKVGGNVVERATTGCSHTHKELEPGQEVRYHIAAVNVGPSERQSKWSSSSTQTTEASTKPDKPEGLVAEGMGHDTINLFWNVQSQRPPAAPILAYIIEYGQATKDADGKITEWSDWDELARITDADADDNGNMIVRTMYSDTGLMGDTTRRYRVRAENMPTVGMLAKSEESDHAEATTDAAPPNNAPMAGDDIPAQRVEVNGTAMVESTITDADMDDTLTWEWSSSDMTVATVAMDATDGSMATITGVAAGDATITVKATDMAGAYDMQTVMVTVTPDPIRPTITGTPTVLGSSISVIWDTASNQGAEQIKVVLWELNADGDVLRLATGYAGNAHTINPSVSNPGAHTFTNVPAGTYKVAVVNYANGVHRSIVSGEVTVQ